jgi:hypothetical protein
MNTNMSFIRNSLEEMVVDKLDNLCDCEISEEVYQFLQGKEDKIVENAYSLLESGELLDGYDYDLILDWSNYDEFQGISNITTDIIKNCSTSTMNEISRDALYNYDLLWVKAIYKAFPKKVTNPKNGIITLKSKWAEIRCDFFDEIDQKWCVDAWKTNSDNEEGKVIAKISLDKSIEYLDKDAETDKYAQEIIQNKIKML